jgi:hypothetical protein
MTLRGHKGAEFKLNVTQFRSTMSASISTVQVRSMSHHFPIRAGQPDIQFTVQFRSIDDHHAFRDFVRDHQRNTQKADHSPAHLDNSGMITLTWPERGINGWTGYITSLPVREARFDYAPRLTFGVMLVKSMLSDRTYEFSRGGDFFTIASNQMAPYLGALAEDMIRPPTPPASLQPPTDGSNEQDNQETGIFDSLFNWVGGIFS